MYCFCVNQRCHCLILTVYLQFHAGGVLPEGPEDVSELGGVDAAVAVLVELAEGVVVLPDVAGADSHPGKGIVTLVSHPPNYQQTFGTSYLELVFSLVAS